MTLNYMCVLILIYYNDRIKRINIYNDKYI